jgi:transposase
VAAPKKYPDELRERAVRLYRQTEPQPVIRRLAEQLGVHHEALRNWIRQDEANRGERDDRPTTAEAEELRLLRRENAELRRANEILTPETGLQGAYLRKGGLTGSTRQNPHATPAPDLVNRDFTAGPPTLVTTRPSSPSQWQWRTHPASSSPGKNGPGATVPMPLRGTDRRLPPIRMLPRRAVRAVGGTDPGGRDAGAACSAALAQGGAPTPVVRRSPRASSSPTAPTPTFSN